MKLAILDSLALATHCIVLCSGCGKDALHCAQKRLSSGLFQFIIVEWFTVQHRHTQTDQEIRLKCKHKYKLYAEKQTYLESVERSVVFSYEWNDVSGEKLSRQTAARYNIIS